ncbi:MAG: Mismatch repair protein msh3 [Watsoniomyces obsoletus]|nr:MAG: Mismatch repair protein msh3 [Watsoniomyces obsoletus]
MSSLRCWRCAITSLRPPQIPLPLSTRSFSTTIIAYKAPLMKPVSKAARSSARSTNPGKTLRVKKKPVVKSVRRFALGERKAFRKRVVLSNPNALEVRNVSELDAEKMSDPKSAGSMLALPDRLVEQLRALGAFKITQRWSAFRKPAVLWTSQSVKMAQDLEGVVKDDQYKTIRRVVTGERNSGKSQMLLQAMTVALMKKWVVISIPEGQELTIAHTDYTPLPETRPIQYIQRTYTASLLSQIARVNEEVLSTMQLSKKHSMPIPLQSNMTLGRLAQLGASDPDLAWPIFQAFWDELTNPSIDGDTKQQPRPPILLCLDGLNWIMRLSEYRDADFNLIHSHDLALVRHFTDHLSGLRKLSNGGAIIGATSASNKPPAATFQLMIRRLEAQLAANVNEKDIPKINPFEKHDRRVMEVLSSKEVEIYRMKGLKRDETKALLEYYAASGLLRDTVDERRVSENWTLAGGGIVGEIERNALVPKI